MILDPSDDWQIWDNLQAATITTNVRGPSQRINWPATAKKTAVTYREQVASGGAYVSQDRKWLVPVQFLPKDSGPSIGDKVTDSDGTVWTVISSALNTWGTWWALTCRNLVLTAGLSDTAGLFRPANSQDDAGGRLPGYAVVPGFDSMAVRIQEVSATVEVRNGKRQATRKFTCFCSERFYPEAQDRIVSSSGTIYQITDWLNADRVDLLMEINLEIVQ